MPISTQVIDVTDVLSRSATSSDSRGKFGTGPFAKVLSLRRTKATCIYIFHIKIRVYGRN
jgi:hypothetical protein